MSDGPLNAASIPSDAKPALTSRARRQKDKVSGNPVIVYPEGVLVLNPTGERILDLCDGKRTFEEIVTELAVRFNAPAATIEIEAARFLQRLRERNVLDLRGVQSQ